MEDKLRYPEYENDAIFKCSEGCGESRRDHCGTHNGRLVCPLCKYLGTLSFTGRLARDAAKGGA